MNKRYIMVTVILMALICFFCGCQKQYYPDDVKTIVAENFDLLKETADLTINKNLSSPISMYELKDIEGLSKEELRIFKECQKIGIKDLYYSNRKDNNGNKMYNDNHFYLLFEFYYEPMCQAILYIPPYSDFETPKDAICYIQSIEQGDIEEVTQLDENWYYYRCKW